MARFREIALWLGLLAGVGAALVTLAQRPSDAPPDGSAAVVDDAVISRDRYLRTLASFAARDRAPALDEAQRRRVLEDLIAEELLLSRALALDLPRRDPLLRRRVLAQLLADVTTEADAEPVEEAELRTLFEEERDLFSARQTFEVQTAWFRGDAAASLRRAEDARRAVEGGEDFPAAAERLGDPPLVALPVGALSPAALREYLGPTAARRITEMAPGALSEPIRGTGGHRLVRLVARHETTPPDFERVRESVRTLVVRRRQAAAIEAYVAELRENARIRVDDSLFAPSFTVPAGYLEAARRPGAEPGKR